MMDPHSGDLWGQVVSESGVCICGDPVGTGPRGFDQLACDQKTTRHKLARDQKTLIKPVVSCSRASSRAENPYKTCRFLLAS